MVLGMSENLRIAFYPHQTMIVIVIIKSIYNCKTLLPHEVTWKPAFCVYTQGIHDAPQEEGCLAHTYADVRDHSGRCASPWLS